MHKSTIGINMSSIVLMCSFARSNEVLISVFEQLLQSKKKNKISVCVYIRYGFTMEWVRVFSSHTTYHRCDLVCTQKLFRWIHSIQSPESWTSLGKLFAMWTMNDAMTFNYVQLLYTFCGLVGRSHMFM